MHLTVLFYSEVEHLTWRCGSPESGWQLPVKLLRFYYVLFAKIRSGHEGWGVRKRIEGRGGVQVKGERTGNNIQTVNRFKQSMYIHVK